MRRIIKTKHHKVKDYIPVWIIDDNRSFCVLLSECLNSSKTVRCEHYFHSSRAALRALAQTRFPPTVILLDIKMPVVSGIDSIIPIKEHSPHSIIIMLTSYDRENEITTALHRGASGYLLKTSTPQDIVRAIENAKQGGSPIDPMITKKILSVLVATPNGIEHRNNLTVREREVIKYIVKGFSTKRIAATLCISYYTVDTHLKNIYHKLDVHNRHTLVVKAYNDHLVS